MKATTLLLLLGGSLALLGLSRRRAPTLQAPGERRPSPQLTAAYVGSMNEGDLCPGCKRNLLWLTEHDRPELEQGKAPRSIWQSGEHLIPIVNQHGLESTLIAGQRLCQWNPTLWSTPPQGISTRADGTLQTDE
jgi:hypothetical protein